jgi:iron complex outermembrane receptor protein
VTASDIHYDETLSGNLAKYEQVLWSAGAEIEVPVRASTMLAGGVVLDKASTPETGGRTPGQAPIDNVGWRAGISHELNAAWRLHASASQRSRFPALRELYSGSLNRFSPNPDLEPETLLGFEAGVTMNRAMGATGNAVVEVTGFQHKLDDAVVRITLPAPDNRFRRVNRDEIESSGAELLAGFTFGGVGDRAFSITGDALLQQITIRDKSLAGQPERHSENNPETRGSLELGAPVPLKLRALANARYTGKQYCLNADTGDEMTLDSQTETDLALERTFTVGTGLFRSLRALVSLDNVGNTTVYDQCGLPQPGRTVRLMFTLR